MHETLDYHSSKSREYESPKLSPAHFGRVCPRELDRVRRSDETLRRDTPDLPRAKYEIAVHHLRFNGPGGEPDVLAQHDEPGGFKPPINWMVRDQYGEAVRVTIDVKRSRETVVFH
jgi:hypothetical protein